MHVLNMEVWIILKVIVLRTKVPRVGKQAMHQEFVPCAERATIGLRCANLSLALWTVHCWETRGGASSNLLTENSLWGHEPAAQPKRSFLDLSGQNEEVQD